MIKFESNMLVLNNTFSNEDVEQINAFADYVRKQERERIITLIQDNSCNCNASGCMKFDMGDAEIITGLICEE